MSLPATRTAVACLQGGVLAATLLLSGCLTVDEDGRIGWESWHDYYGEENPLERLRERIARQDPHAMRDFWRRTIEGLHGEDLESLSDMAETVDFIAEHYAWLPGIREYDEWLQSRKLYFEAARHTLAVERQVRAQPRRPTAPRPRPPVRTPTPSHPLPSALSKAPPSFFQPEGRPQGVLRDSVQTGRAYWRATLDSQPRPRRADEWIPVLEKTFQEEGLPPELVWIAEVESSMNPKARSPAGAVGLFQLMPQTAVSLGLSVRPEDQRLDGEANARAAARYLRQLHNRFECWSLALAAYNAGQGRVSSLCRRHGRSFDAIAANLPMETRLYVPRVFETVRARTGADPETLPGPS